MRELRVRRLDRGGLLLAAWVAACSPADSGPPEAIDTKDVFSAIVAAGASPVSSGPLERDEICSRQTSAFAVSGDWVRFLGRLENELPAEFERRGSGEGGVAVFSRLLPGDVESVELLPKSAEKGDRIEVRYSICAG